MTDDTQAVELCLAGGSYLVGADDGGHEEFGELIRESHESLSCLLVHGGLHPSAADGRSTEPELALRIQVHNVSGSPRLGRRLWGHKPVGGARWLA